MTIPVTALVPLVALLTLLAGAIGAWAAVKYTANSAKEKADATATAVHEMALDMAVLKTEVKHLTEGLQAATRAVEALASSLSSLVNRQY